MARKVGLALKEPLHFSFHTYTWPFGNVSSRLLYTFAA